MGLLDTLAGAAGQMLQNQQGGGNANLIQAVLGMLGSNSAHGGLEGLVNQFTQAGLGSQVQSWIGTGSNLPVSPDQLGQALGGSNIDALAQQTGIPGGDLSAQLAALLPGLIDKLTPDGQIPAGGIDNALGSLLGPSGAQANE